MSRKNAWELENGSKAYQSLLCGKAARDCPLALTFSLDKAACHCEAAIFAAEAISSLQAKPRL